MNSEMNNYAYEEYRIIKDMLSPNLISSLDSKPLSSECKTLTEDGYGILSSSDKLEPVLEYKINRNGFRSQHFENFNSEDINVLVAGCSFTYGDGLPENYVWGNLLTNKIQSKFLDKSVQQYNLGTSGGSISLACRNVLAFIRKYDSVDYVYMLLPGFDRSTVVEKIKKDKEYRMKRVYYASPESPLFKDKEVKKFTLDYEPVNSIYHTLVLVQSVIDICKLKGIRLFFGTWISFDKEVYMHEKFFGYCDTPAWNGVSEKYKSHDPTLRDTALDAVHPGLNYMEKVADVFYEATFNG
jgi:hypothetical protein